MVVALGSAGQRLRRHPVRGLAVRDVEGGPGAAGAAAAAGRGAAHGHRRLALLPGARGRGGRARHGRAGDPRPRAAAVRVHRARRRARPARTAPPRRAAPAGHGRPPLVPPGYDLDRQDWRSFRLDRLARPRGHPRRLPAARHPRRRRRGVRAGGPVAGGAGAAADRASTRRARHVERRIGPWARIVRGRPRPGAGSRSRPPTPTGPPSGSPTSTPRSRSTRRPPVVRRHAADVVGAARRDAALPRRVGSAGLLLARPSWWSSSPRLLRGGLLRASSPDPTRRGSSWRPGPTSAARPAGRRPRRRTWSTWASA